MFAASTDNEILAYAKNHAGNAASDASSMPALCLAGVTCGIWARIRLRRVIIAPAVRAPASRGSLYRGENRGIDGVHAVVRNKRIPDLTHNVKAISRIDHPAAEIAVTTTIQRIGQHLRAAGWRDQAIVFNHLGVVGRRHAAERIANG